MKRLIIAFGIFFASTAFAATGDRVIGQPAFANLSGAGAKISASAPNDTLKFVGGTGATVGVNKATKTVTISATGTGDVTGPASATDGIIAVFNGTTGKTLKTGGQSVANVLDRGNHTGAQAISTVTGLQPALDTKMDKSGGTFTGSVTGPSFTSNSADGTHYVDTGNTSDTDTTGWSTSEEGRFWYNKTSDKFRYWNGSAATDWPGGSSGASSLAELSDWPAAVSVTELGHLDGVTSGIQGQIDGKAASSHVHASSAITYDNVVSGLAATDVKAALDELKGTITAQNSLITNLTTAITNAGVDTTPPVLTRNAPATTTPTGTASSLTINYIASDTCPSAPCMDVTHPLQYAINGGSSVDFTSGADAVLSGFAANTPTAVVVTAKNTAGMTTPETITYTYQTPVASISPSSKAFANTITGESSAAQTFTITNTGLANLTLSPGIAVTGTDAGQFPLSKGTCTDGATITPAGTCSASVTFSPSSTGAKTASLLVDSLIAADVTASLSGTAVADTTYLVNENFNAGGTPSGWTAGAGTPFAYTPALEGAYSIHVSSTANAYSPAFAPAADLYVAVLMQQNTAFPTTVPKLIAIRNGNATPTTMTYFSVNSTGRVYAETVSSAGVVLTIDSPIYIKLRYQKGTGSNSIATVWSSPTGATGTWTQQAQKTNGTWVDDAVKVLFYSDSVNNTIFDRIRISTTDINY